MHVIAELEQRLRDSRQLMALEQEHLRRVREAGLDSSDAEWLLELRQRYIERLEKRHDHIVTRRVVANARANVPISTVACEEVPLPQGSPRAKA